MVYPKYLLLFLLSFAFGCQLMSQTDARVIEIPEGIHPGMTKKEVAQIDPRLVKGTVTNSNKVRYDDTLGYIGEQVQLYYTNDTLVEIYWEHAVKSLDTDEIKTLLETVNRQVEFFTSIYHKPEEYSTNPVPEDYLRQWRSIVYASWNTDYGKIEVRVDYLTRVFEDPAEIEDGTYDREFEVEISYRRN